MRERQSQQQEKITGTKSTRQHKAVPGSSPGKGSFRTPKVNTTEEWRREKFCSLSEHVTGIKVTHPITGIKRTNPN
jgi:hypothetical protein